MQSPIGTIKSISLREGRLFVENVAGEECAIDLPLLYITGATQTRMAIFATDGRRVFKYNGRTVEDVTKGVRKA